MSGRTVVARERIHIDHGGKNVKTSPPIRDEMPGPLEIESRAEKRGDFPIHKIKINLGRFLL